MRRLSFTNKKIRGVPRRLRELDRWAADFLGYFPAGLSADDRCQCFKLPILQGLVDGRHASQAVRRVCAQRVVDACSNLIQSKPAHARPFRVVALLSWPDLFPSRVCIYTDEEIFQRQMYTGEHEFGSVKAITNRSFAKERGLVLPAGFSERGLEVQGTGSDGTGWYVFEHWFFGEVA
jgi:hypothetical protein